MANNDFKVGDTVHHKLDPDSRMVIIKVNENVYSCKYYGKGKFDTKDLYRHELKLNKPYEEDPAVTFEMGEVVQFPSTPNVRMLILEASDGNYKCRLWDQGGRSFVDETFEKHELIKINKDEPSYISFGW